MSLTKKTVTSFFWTFGQQVSVQFINFIETIILARLLLPKDFGIIGMLSILMSIGNVLIDSGLTSSLIRTSKVDKNDYSTVFFLNLFGSVFIYFIVFFLTPFVADFYKQPILNQIIRVYALTFIIRAFSSVQLTKLTKELNFKLQMMIQIPSEIMGSAIGIFLAWLGDGVWSLVWMNVCQAIIYSAQLWVRTGWRPHLYFNKKLFKTHFNFGYKLTISGLIESIYQNLYTLIIGKYFSATALGYYTYAITLRQLPIQNISNALDKVTYPIFSSIQDNDVKLKSAYKKLMQQVIFWIAPSLIILTVLAEPLFRFLLTDKWLPAVPYFQILAIAGILFPIQAYNLNILKVKGKSNLVLRLQIIKKTYSVLGIFLALQFGIYGLLYFQIITTVISFVVNTWYSGRLINYPMKEQITDLLPSIVLAGVIGVGAYFLDSYLHHYLHLIDLARLVIIGLIYFAAYLCISYLIKINSFNDFRQLILKR